MLDGTGLSCDAASADDHGGFEAVQGLELLQRGLHDMLEVNISEVVGVVFLVDHDDGLLLAGDVG